MVTCAQDPNTEHLGYGIKPYLHPSISQIIHELPNNQVEYAENSHRVNTDCSIRVGQPVDDGPLRAAIYASRPFRMMETRDSHVHLFFTWVFTWLPTL